MALGELGLALQHQGNLDEAEDDFRRQAEIYKSVYGDKSQQLGAAIAYLAGLYADRKDYAKSEQLYRDALKLYADSLPEGHLNIAIAHVKLGGVLFRDKRYSEAEAESRAGYELLMKQSTPPALWVQTARNDLLSEYDAMDQSEKAAKVRSELGGPAAASNPAKN